METDRAFIARTATEEGQPGTALGVARACFEGILWILRTGAAWRFFPAEYPSPATCWRRPKQWQNEGVWRAEISCRHDGQQPQVADSPEPAGTQLRRREAQQRVDRRRDLHHHRRRLAVPGRGDGSVPPPHRGLVIVGWSMKTTIDRSLASEAPQRACLQRRPRAGKAIFPRDRGSQYANQDSREGMRMYGLIPSRSRKANGLDPPVAPETNALDDRLPEPDRVRTSPAATAA